MSDRLVELSTLLRARSAIDNQIAEIIGRPAHAGHIGEYIAAIVFDIALHESATHRSSDGFFVSGPLAGKSVNIKLYSKDSGLIDVAESSDVAEHANTYLILVGKRGNNASSMGTSAPISIESVYLFESEVLVPRLVGRGVKLGSATSVQTAAWREAMIYPNANNPTLVLTLEQRGLLAHFSADADPMP